MVRIAAVLALGVLAYVGAMMLTDVALVLVDTPLPVVDAYAAIAGYAVFIATYGVVRRRRLQADLLPLLGARPWTMAVRSLAGAALAYLLIVAMIGLAHGAPHLDRGFDPGNLVALVFILLAAATEEVLCRGYLFAMARQRFGAGTAIVVAALVFALLHGRAALAGWDSFTAFFTFGTALTMLALRFGSLLPGIVAHGVFNYCTGLRGLRLPPPLDASGIVTYEGGSPEHAYLASQILVGLAVSVGLIPYVVRHREHAKTAREAANAAEARS